MEDKQRMILAILMMLAVALIPSIFFSRRTAVPPAPIENPPPNPAGVESVAVAPERTDIGEFGGLQDSTNESEAGHLAATVTVSSAIYEYTFSTSGGRLVGATLLNYHDLSTNSSGPAQVIPENSEFLTHRLVFGQDTVSLASWQFEPSQRELQVGPQGGTLTMIASRGQVSVRLTYTFRPDEYLFRVRGELDGFPGEPLLMLGLGPGLRSVEADSTTDFNSYGVVTRAVNTRNLKFNSLDVGEAAVLEGPFDWVAIKSKYFLGAVLSVGGETGMPRFGGGAARGLKKSGRSTTRVSVVASLAVPAKAFSYSVYVGPQEYRRLARIGYDLEDVNPYGWVLRPIIRPVSLVIVRILLWGHQVVGLHYGWLLMIFGVGIRVLLWPLNQKAMKSQMALQSLQPEIEALRRKYKDDQQRLGQETLKLHRERGVNPMGGCLPMLLPMPILFAMFFVLLNTIELRGVPFLWLPDLSRADPLYIIPLLMGASMFVVSKLGQRGLPPNPQAKMMLYVMPVFMTFLFLRFSSGLNLYYASQNLASIPQQWLIAKQRAALKKA